MSASCGCGIELHAERLTPRAHAPTPAWGVANAMYERGHFTRPIGNAIQLVPPLSSATSELDSFMEALRRVVMEAIPRSRVRDALAEEIETTRFAPAASSPAIANTPLRGFPLRMIILGLSRSPVVVEAMRVARLTGSGGSRLLSGAHPEHAALEKELARFVKRERALLFSSGYLAGIGAIHTASLLVKHAYSDADNHASIIDALRLTRLARHVFPHLQATAQGRTRCAALLVCESLFGMSGERANDSRVARTPRHGRRVASR